MSESSSGNKLWDVMNDLQMVSSKIVSAREIIDSVAEAIQRNDYNKAETLAMAAYEFLGYYLDEFDDRFQLAWQETVVKQNQNYLANDLLTKDRDSNFPDDLMPPWGHSDMEAMKYSEEELNAMCDAAEKAEREKKLSELIDDDDEYLEALSKLNKNKTWTVPIEEDHLGEYYVTFPDELIEKVGWSENDTLEWIDNKDGTFSIKKVEN